MTVLVSLQTKDSIVAGCDSLATQSKDFINPADIIDRYFDINTKNIDILKDGAGNPLLDNAIKLVELVQKIPYNHLSQVTKLYSLDPMKIIVLTTGIASIGKRTIRYLIEDFQVKVLKHISSDYTVRTIGNKLRRHFRKAYNKIYPPQRTPLKPYLELMITGYSSRFREPETWRIYVHLNKLVPSLKRGKFGVAYGGQYKEIERIIKGTDSKNYQNMEDRHFVKILEYKSKVENLLQRRNLKVRLPNPLSDANYQKFRMQEGGWKLDKFESIYGDFSEQNSVDFVNWMVDIMIKAQQFNNRMPTVGGDVHIALLTKKDGFEFISKEVLTHATHEVYKSQLRRNKE